MSTSGQIGQRPLTAEPADGATPEKFFSVRLTDGVNFYSATGGGGGGGTVAVSNFPGVQPVSGTVAVSSVPAISISNFPATQPVSGTVTANIGSVSTLATNATLTQVRDRLPSVLVGGKLPVDVAFPATQAVSGTVAVSNLPATQPVSGTVAVSSLPAVTGAVSVSNFPGTQPVSGTVAVSNLPTTQPVSGTVSVGNFPATQPVSGTVAVSNLPATQPVSGTISVANFPVDQPVSGTVSVGNTVTVSGSVNTSETSLLRAETLGSTTGIGAVCTMPLASGLFHYISKIEIQLYNTATRVGGVTPVTVTSSNFQNPVAWLFSSAGQVGTVERVTIDFPKPVRSASPSASTSISAPAVANALWRINAYYNTGT